MVYRHSLVTRVTHATFFLSFLALATTGVSIALHLRIVPLSPLRIHEYFGLAMIASGCVYVSGGILSGDLRKLLFGAADVRGLGPMIAYYLRLRRNAPSYTDYNPLQKLAYTAVLLMIGPLMAATGVAIWPHLAAAGPLRALLGGRQAKVLHIGFAVELALFFGGHMVMVATTGLRKNLRAIITGWYGERAPEPVVEMVSATEWRRVS